MQGRHTCQQPKTDQMCLGIVIKRKKTQARPCFWPKDKDRLGHSHQVLLCLGYQSQAELPSCRCDTYAECRFQMGLITIGRCLHQTAQSYSVKSE